MENSARLLGSKKSKWIVSIGLILIGIGSIFAVWKLLIHRPAALTCKVEYIKEIGDVIVQTYLKGEKLSFPDTPTKSGYDFVGWSLDENKNNFITTEIVVDKALTLYAKWQEKEIKLSFNDLEFTLDGNSSLTLSGNNVCINAGGKTTFIAPPEVKNKDFDKWVIIDKEAAIDFNSFNLANVTSNTLTLQPIYKDVYVTYSIVADLSFASIKNVNQAGIVALSNTLSFEFELNDSVSNSNLTITTNSGNVSYEKVGNIYNVVISDFTNNFCVHINNITTNNYLVTYTTDNETLTYNQLYGDTLIMPTLTKEGYTLVGFKDSNDKLYTKDHKVVSNLNLYPVWKLNTYNVSLPVTNGMYVIVYNGEFLTNGKTLVLEHGDKLSFEIKLSRAYSNSNINVYAETLNGRIVPDKTNSVYTFNNITSNHNIIIDNVVLNSYVVNIDGKNCGAFGYGSWIEVSNNNIIITNTLTNTNATFTPLINDNGFGGWILNNYEILTNAFIQEIETNGTIYIDGNYSKQLTRVQLVLNGGICEINELILTEDQQPVLPTPTKSGYVFAGWFTTLVEINTVVNKEQSEQFDYEQHKNNKYIIVFAGWELNI